MSKSLFISLGFNTKNIFWYNIIFYQSNLTFQIASYAIQNPPLLFYDPRQSLPRFSLDVHNLMIKCILVPTELTKKVWSYHKRLTSTENCEGRFMGTYISMRVAARRWRALGTLMKKCEPMNLLSQFCVEVGLLW